VIFCRSRKGDINVDVEDQLGCRLDLSDFGKRQVSAYCEHGMELVIPKMLSEC